jgi:hypothetical protein
MLPRAAAQQGASIEIIGWQAWKTLLYRTERDAIAVIRTEGP